MEHPVAVPERERLIDERARRFSPAERLTAELLAGEGRRVVALASAPEGRSRPDALVDGQETGFETVGPGATTVAVVMALSRAVRHARHVVVDVRNSRLSESDARRGALLFFETPQAVSVLSCRIAGDGFDLRWGTPG